MYSALNEQDWRVNETIFQVWQPGDAAGSYTSTQVQRFENKNQFSFALGPSSGTSGSACISIYVCILMHSVKQQAAIAWWLENFACVQKVVGSTEITTEVPLNKSLCHG